MRKDLSRRTRRPTAFGGLRLGRLFGTELVADFSLVLIFILIASQLGWGVFPRWHPNWSAGLVWLVAISAALLFFASITVHELSHALVARRFQIPVRRITLFLFGGVAELEREPGSPRAEFLIAAVGPVVSVAIGFASLLAGNWIAQDVHLAHGEEFLATMRNLGPLATILLWLGPINLSLALFNLVPGFPLDGGRVLRSILWAVTGDLHAATTWASRSGQAFAWLLMAAGVATLLGVDVPWFGPGARQGLWLVLIGWFLNNAARRSLQQLLVREALDAVPVRDVMRSGMDTVRPEVPLDELVRSYFMNSDQKEFPVAREGVLLGMISIDDVRRVPRERWERLTVQEAMTPAGQVHTLSPNDDAYDALRELAEHDALPVIDHERLVGVARRADILKWLSLHAQRA